MRIRSIKPEFFMHDGLYELETEKSLPLRLAFIGLWCASDREGRFQWEPRRLGASILPYDRSIEFSHVLDALLSRGFIVKYRVNGAWYGWIPTWKKHQIINNKERASVLPAIDTAEEIIDTRPERVINASVTRLEQDDNTPSTPSTPPQAHQEDGTGLEPELPIMQEPKNEDNANASTTRESRDNNATSGEGKGREGKGDKRKNSCNC